MTFKEKIAIFFEYICTALLLGSQTILNSGICISVMIMPLLPYLIYLPKYQEMNHNVLLADISTTFFRNDFISGQLVFLLGLIVFLIAAFQWAIYNYRKVGLFKKGLYSKVRHPQFTGIIIMTLGLTLIVLINENYSFAGPFLIGVTLDLFSMVGLWFLQVLGYLVIAHYEDRRLSKKYGDEFKHYRSNVPLLFPLRSPKKTPEILFTLLLIVAICLVLLILPYSQIRVSSHRYIPQIPFP